MTSEAYMCVYVALLVTTHMLIKLSEDWTLDHQQRTATIILTHLLCFRYAYE